MLAAATGTAAAGSLIISQPAHADSGSENCWFEFGGGPVVNFTAVNTLVGDFFDVDMSNTGPGASPGAPRAVPQLRYGGTLLARSRSAPDVVDALDAVLGGVLAHQDHTGVRVFLRPFVAGDRVVLVDADAPMLVNDPGLARSGIVELSTWSVAVSPAATDGTAPVLEVAAPLSDPGRVGRYELAGIVGVLGEPPAGDAGLLARYATRHPSPDWFRTVHALVEGQRLLTATDRSHARSAIARLLA